MKFHWGNVSAALGLYLGLVIAAGAELGVTAAVSLVVYFLLSWGLLCFMLSGAVSRQRSGSYDFWRDGAMNAMGETFGSFSHVFCCETYLGDELSQKMEALLRRRLGCGEAGTVTLRDIDPEQPERESREFRRILLPSDKYGTVCTLVFSQSVTGDAQGVRWWLLAKGPRNPNSLFWMYALAPIGNLFRLKEYFLRGYFPLSHLYTIRPGTFSILDVTNRLNEAHAVAFDILVETLDEHGVDTSGLKARNVNAMNINVSGGSASFNNVVQGAMTKIMGKA